MTRNEADAELDAWIGRLAAFGQNTDQALNSIAFITSAPSWDARSPQEGRRGALATHLCSFYGPAK